MYGNTSYLCGPDRINIIDTSSVSAPAYVGEFGDADLAGNGGKCAINLNTSEPILVDIVGPGSTPTFAVYSLSNPDSPVKLAQQSTTPYTFSPTSASLELSDTSAPVGSQPAEPPSPRSMGTSSLTISVPCFPFWWALSQAGRDRPAPA